MKRLKEAGVPMDRGIPKCTNCNGKTFSPLEYIIGDRGLADIA